MSLRRLSTFALALVAWPHQADACEPTYYIDGVLPAGGELPANAFAVFSGNFVGGSYLFTVRVDGEPVEFIVSKHLSEARGPIRHTALRPLVPPPVGRTWSVTFDSDGPDEVHIFTVTAPDETPPASVPESLYFDVNDFASSLCTSCGNFAVDYWPHFAGAVQDGGTPLVQALYMGHPGADDDQLAAIRSVDSQAPLRELVEEAWFADDIPVTEGMCFTLRLLDLAGNEAATALRTCKPCHARIDPMQQSCEGDFPPPEEPAWTDADLFAGGACESETALPLPPEQFPEPEPDMTTGDTTAGETGTGETTTGETTTGETTTGSMSSAPTTANTSSEQPVPTTSSATSLEPTTADPGVTGTEGSSEGSSEGVGETPDKVGCGCRGGAWSPWGLVLLAPAGRRRRSRRA